MKLITHLSWLLRALLFLAIFAFALLNTDRVTLRFFLGQTWETPMIVVLLLFFAFGAGIGVLACLSRLRSEEHTSELQSHHDLVCRLLLEKKKLEPFLSHRQICSLSLSR